jgi:hypothetical protein
MPSKKAGRGEKDSKARTNNQSFINYTAQKRVELYEVEEVIEVQVIPLRACESSKLIPPPWSRAV